MSFSRWATGGKLPVPDKELGVFEHKFARSEGFASRLDVAARQCYRNLR